MNPDDCEVKEYIDNKPCYLTSDGKYEFYIKLSIIKHGIMIWIIILS